MPRSTFLIAVGGTLGGLAFLLGILGVIFEPLLMLLAIPFMISGYVIWFHGTGRLEFRTKVRGERARTEGAFRGRGRRSRGDRHRAAGEEGSGPRWADEEWYRQRERARRGPQGGPTADGGGRRRTRDPNAGSSVSATEAYDRLDLDPQSSEAEVRAAYREKVKEVHPDTEGGDEEAFKEVTEAYERLTDRAS